MLEQLDYSIQNADNRILQTEELLDHIDFNTLTEKEQKNLLNNITNYILFAPDQREKKPKYKFLSSVDFKKLNKSEVVSDDIIYLLEQNFKNEYKSYPQVIHKSDLNIPCIKSMQDFIFLLKRLLENENDAIKKQFYKKHMALTKKDQFLAKDIINGYIKFKQVLPNTTVYDLSGFDFHNPKHVLALMQFNKDNAQPHTDLYYLLLDLEIYISKCKFNELDLEILRMYQQGYSMRAISEIVELSKMYALRHLEDIAKKISKIAKGD